MKDYLYKLKIRLKSKEWFSLILSWHFLLIKKLFKANFREENDEESLKLTIDIVIPTISKDFELLKVVLEGIKKNIRHKINNIYIVSRNDQFLEAFCTENKLTFIDEKSVLGYGKDKINYNINGEDRSGWLFQQLLKLGAYRFVESENYIVVDSDTVLISPHQFVQNKKFIFLQSEEWHEAYYQSFIKMFGYSPKYFVSYVSHMMIFNTKKLIIMHNELEKKHNISWDKIYISTTENNDSSCVSEYFNYANWMIINFKNETRSKIFYNKGLDRDKFNNLDILTNKYYKKYASLSFHSYIKNDYFKT